MSEKWVERIVTAALVIGAMISVGILLTGCSAMVLVAWKML